MSLIVPDSSRSQAAFGTPLVCCYQVMRNHTMEDCGSKRWEFMEDIGPYRKRYRCKDCKRTIQYDYAARATHPYAPLAKVSLYRKLVDAWNKRHPDHTQPLAGKVTKGPQGAL